MRSRVFLILISFLFVAFAACDDDGGTTNNSTTCDPACAEGESCVDGACVATSVDDCDPACAEGESCVDSACVPTPVQDCDPTCAEGESCVNGECVADDPDACDPACPEDQTCMAGSCVTSVQPPPCDSGEPEAMECGEGATCVEGECVEDVPAECDPACAEGESCVDGACVPTPVEDCDPACADGESCVDGECVAALGNLVEVATAAGDFATLIGAVQAAGLADTIADGGPFTIFAPTDAAIGALLADAGLTAEELLADTEALANILTYHVVEGTVLAADVIALDGQSVTTLQGSDVAISVVDGGVVLNGSVNVTATDVMASNGVIHVIDYVLTPPAECTPSCDGQPICGSDGCDGVCGDCTDGATWVDISGFAFAPADITVATGTTVTWTNLDAAQHNVVSMAGDGSVDTAGPLDGPMLAQDESWSFTFDIVGTHDYRCAPHPNMVGSVTVVD